jgi:hemolysin activation/secretion protein
MRDPLVRSFDGFLLGLSVLTASAQTFAVEVPNAGTLLQQIERERRPALPPKSSGVEQTAPEVIPAQAGVVATVKTFRFAGNSLLTAEQLNPAVAGYLNRPLDYTQLQAAAAAVASVYRDAGWVVRSYLPRQDITEGVVTIQIVEAQFGGAKLTGEPPKRVSEQKIMGIVAAQQKSGKQLNAGALDRSLLLIDDLPGVSVAGRLRAGEQEGETVVDLKTVDDPWVMGQGGVDNAGPRSTGEWRPWVNLNLNSVLGLGDLIGLSAIHSEGSDFVRMAASMPVGNDGWRAGVSGSYLYYELVHKDFERLNASGSSHSAGLDLTYPLIRSRLKNLFLGLNYDYLSFDNWAQQQAVTQYTLHNFSAGLQGNLFDELWGGGTNTMNVAITRGEIDDHLADLRNKLPADGGFTKLRYQFSRQQYISEDWSVFGAFSGQWADKNVDTSQRFYLGGPYGVRAYPVNEAGGVEGQMLNLEVRHKLPAGFNVTGFYDFGRVRVKHDNGSDSVGPNDYTLQGAGLSLDWQSSFGLAVKGTWAHRLGNNPAGIAKPGEGVTVDQDGSFRDDRFWLLITQQF